MFILTYCVLYLQDSDAISRLQKMLSLLEAAIDKLNNTTQDLTEDGLKKGNQIEVSKFFFVFPGNDVKLANTDIIY